MIDAYLDALGRELSRAGMSPRHARRIVAEAEDHLRESAGALRRTGEQATPDAAESEAVARFGAPSLVAARFADALLGRAAERAALATAVAVAVQLGFAAAASYRPVWLAFPRWNTLRSGAVIMLAVQVAAVAAALAVLRAVAARIRGGQTSRDRRDVVRASTVAVAALAAGAIDAVAVQLGDLHGATSSAGGAALAGAVLLVAFATAAAAALVLPLSMRTRSDSPGSPGAFVDDAAVIATAALHRAPQLQRIAARVASGGALQRLDPRPHPWRFCFAVAALALAAGGAVEVLQGFDPGPILVVAEAAAIVAGFALLGGVLNLRPPLRRRAQQR